MALSGIQIYKMLPQTNCKDCGFPTCLAFAMKLAAKQVELSLCPHVSQESQAKLSAAAAPPVRPVVLRANGSEMPSGNEVVLFRHEKRFYSHPGLFYRVFDTESSEAIRERATAVAQYRVDYVGMELRPGGICVQADGGDFAAAVAAVRDVCQVPLVLVAAPAELETVLPQLTDTRPLLAHATADNWEAMATLAKAHGAALAVQAATVDEMVALTEQLRQAGVADLVLAPAQTTMQGTLLANTTARRMALKKSFRALGYPILNFAADAADPEMSLLLAAQAIGKYGSFIVLDQFSPETAYPLLVLRENLYTDPQKPIQVQPGLYEINSPGPADPLLVTTNFSITYFSVANEVESAGLPAWLLVCDAEGMSVLTAWAAGKFDAERIAKDARAYDAGDHISRKQLVLPGHVAVLSGELEEEMPDWEIRVGPREAVDLPAFIRQAL